MVGGVRWAEEGRQGRWAGGGTQQILKRPLSQKSMEVEKNYIKKWYRSAVQCGLWIAVSGSGTRSLSVDRWCMGREALPVSEAALCASAIERL